MQSKELDFLISALTEYNPFLATADIESWMSERREAKNFKVEEVPFSEMDGWFFEAKTGNLVHQSGKFFSIEGITVHSNFGPVPTWSQPIINQPEIGLLGFLTKRFDGILYFLMQLKREPGNINTVQLAPTVQATRSNFTRVHGGESPPYIEYFLGDRRARVLIDSLQSEQGARFLRKRNRNMILETAGEVVVLDDFCWLTLGQIHQLLNLDNVVNMDARTILACISLNAPEISGTTNDGLLAQLGHLDGVDVQLLQHDITPFSSDLLNGLFDVERSLHNADSVMSWVTEQKVMFELEVESIPLRKVKKWYNTGTEIRHEEDNYFTVIGVHVEADGREVSTWSQPMIRPWEEGLVAYLVKKIDGVYHFLVQAKVEPGNLDIVEMAPTIQCITRSYQRLGSEDQPMFLDYVLTAEPEQIRYETMQSEEGGRFFREQNRNLIVEVEENFPVDVPEWFIWLTMNQMKRYIKLNNFFNVQARCLLSCLSFRPPALGRTEGRR